MGKLAKVHVEARDVKSLEGQEWPVKTTAADGEVAALFALTGEEPQGKRRLRRRRRSSQHQTAVCHLPQGLGGILYAVAEHREHRLDSTVKLLFLEPDLKN